MFATSFGKKLCIVLIVFQIIYAQEDEYAKTLNTALRFDKRSRNGNSNDDFEKFFLKASKSVPRIGRRRTEESMNEYKMPALGDLSELYEYNPELFQSPESLRHLMDYYNAQVIGRSNGRNSRPLKKNAANKFEFPSEEINEYRYQPEI